MKNTKKVLVTGGAGFIGSHLVDLLVKEGFKVIVIDDLSTGKLDNLNEQAKFYQRNIVEPSLAQIFEEECIDYVVHCAAQTSVKASIEKPDFDILVNVFGTLNLLESCRKLDVQKFVYLSTSAVYGTPLYLPVHEDHPTKPLSFYGASKLTAEQYIELYYQLYNFDYVILRLANIYGPRQNSKDGEGGVVAIFIENFLMEKTLKINGDGYQSRDFVYVGDVARAILLALTTQTDSKIFNIGSGERTTINQLYKEANNLIGKFVEPIHGEPVLGEIRDMCFDSSRAQNELRWTPETNLANGLKATLDWFTDLR